MMRKALDLGSAVIAGNVVIAGSARRRPVVLNSRRLCRASRERESSEAASFFRKGAAVRTYRD